jgi:SAM-dependent methyltransferase
MAKPGQTAFEFGCFPARYLFEIGSLGYVVNGCDRTPRVADELPAWLSKNQIKTGQFFQCDFRQVPKNRFDVVASFGFVEHFQDYLDVFRFHFEFVKPGGLVLVQFPNFRGAVQRVLRELFDKDNLDNHVVAAMNLTEYKKAAASFGQVLFCGYYGGFDFWTDHFKGSPGPRRLRLLNALERTRPLWPRLPTAAPWAPYGAILVRTKA